MLLSPLLLFLSSSVVVHVAVGADMTHEVVPKGVADSFGAKCLDGSLPTYEIRSNRSNSGFVLFLEGGGWCNGATAQETIASCARRAGFKPLAPEDDRDSLTTADYGGILGSDPTVNPDFYQWNAVFIHYCDGASFGSARWEPIAVHEKDGKHAQMWMRGRANFDAVISDLKQRWGLGAGDNPQVILSGGSAGGLAVFYNLDHLADLLGSTVRLTGFPDAGYFLDGNNSRTGKPEYRDNFLGADPVWNVTGGGGTNEACLTKHSASSDTWKCLLAQYIVPHIRTPLYVMNSAYDAYQLPNIAGTTCVPTARNRCNDSVGEAYGDLFRSEVGAVIAANPANGVYVDSCWVHEQNVNYCSTQSIPNCVGWTPSESGSKKWNYTTSVDGFTPQQAFSAYYLHGQAKKVIDTAQLQHNPTCVFEG